jgi:dTDP-4-amino-4,6-dideoxygalactose transaminase
VIRQQLWRQYDEALGGLDILATPQVHDTAHTRHARHLYTVQLDYDRLGCSRGDFLQALAAENIGSGVHFSPVHLHRWYREAFGTKRGDFPAAESIGDTTVSLPMSAAMTAEDADDVIRAVRKIAARYRRKPAMVVNLAAEDGDESLEEAA